MTNFYKQQCIKSLHFLLVVLSSHTYYCLWLSWDHICWEILQTFPSSTWYTTDHHGLFSATTQPSAIMAENKLMAGGSKATWHRLNRSFLLPNLARILWLKTSQKHWTVETHVSIQRPRQNARVVGVASQLGLFLKPWCCFRRRKCRRPKQESPNFGPPDVSRRGYPAGQPFVITRLY